MEANQILTAKFTSLTDAHISPPASGSAVFVLTHGGKLVETTWKSDTILWADAWAEYPTVPQSVKDRQSQRCLDNIAKYEEQNENN